MDEISVNKSTNEAPTPLNDKIKTAIYCTQFFILGLISSILGPSLECLIKHTNSNKKEISSLFIARGLGWILGSGMGGKLFSYFNGHKIIITSLFAISITHFLVPVIHSVSSLFVVFLFLGLAAGLTEMGGNTLLIWQWKEKVQPYIQFLNFCIGFGALLAPIILALYMEEESYDFSVKFTYWTIAIFIIPLAISLFFFESPKSIPDEDGNEDVGSHGSGNNNGSHSNAILNRFQKIFKSRSLYVIAVTALFMFINSGQEVATGSWIDFYGISQYKYTEKEADFLTSLYYSAFTLGRLITSLVSSRFSSKNLLFVEVLMGLFSIIFLILIIPLKSAFLLCVGISLYGFSLGPQFATGFGVVAESGIFLSSEAVSFIIFCSNIGELLVPTIVGESYSTFGPNVLLFVLLFLTKMGIFNYYLFSKLKYSPKLTDPEKIDFELETSFKSDIVASTDESTANLAVKNTVNQKNK